MSETAPNPETNPEPKEIYLEIGPGLDPSALRGTNTYAGNKFYVGLDLASDESRQYTPDRTYGEEVKLQTPALQEEAKLQRPDENIFFVEGKGQALPLRDQSVQEIYAANVLTAPQDDDNRIKLLHEMGRVLKDDGELIIKVDWDTEAWDKNHVVDMLITSGFELDKIISFDEDPLEYQQIETQRGKSQLHNEPEGYFIFVRKQKEPNLIDSLH